MTPPRGHHTSESIKLPHWLRIGIYAATATLFGSGVVWLIAHYALRPTGEFEPAVHPLEPWMMRVHGFVVMVALILYGSLLRVHIVKGWKVGKNRMTGALVVGVVLVLTVSGYLLYYASGEELRPILSAVHWSIGLALGATLPTHVWRGRRRARHVKLSADRQPKPQHRKTGA